MLIQEHPQCRLDVISENPSSDFEGVSGDDKTCVCACVCVSVCECVFVCVCVRAHVPGIAHVTLRLLQTMRCAHSSVAANIWLLRICVCAFMCHATVHCGCV